MIKFKSLIFILTLFAASSLSETDAQNWPKFRGPRGDGTSTETNLPTKWDSITNIVWKSPVPGIGHSSPIIWEDRLFTTTAIPEKEEKILLCYNSRNGNLLWQKTVIKSPLQRKHTNNSYASGTPSTDGKRVYLSFLDGEDVVVAAYDFSGKQIWLQRPGKYSSPHGFSCSPVLFENKVIININSKGNVDNPGESFLTALNKSDGEIIWKVPLVNPAHSFGTPIFREMGGKMQMICMSSMEVASYNPVDGSKYWFVKGPSEDYCSSPIYNEQEGLVILSSAWPKRILVAIRPDGTGDVTESHVVWRSTEGGSYVPSPISTNGYLYSTMTNGEVHCMDVGSGKVLWVKNMGRQYSSPVLADGLVYMPNDDGVITVLKPGPTFEAIASNAIGERMNASPAISNGKIYLRGYKHLYCIGN
jgi:outer membrane protein assembly factor BamB